MSGTITRKPLPPQKKPSSGGGTGPLPGKGNIMKQDKGV